jgi:hypothetical protein
VHLKVKKYAKDFHSPYVVRGRRNKSKENQGGRKEGRSAEVVVIHGLAVHMARPARPVTSKYRMNNNKLQLHLSRFKIEPLYFLVLIKAYHIRL